MAASPRVDLPSLPKAAGLFKLPAPECDMDRVERRVRTLMPPSLYLGLFKFPLKPGGTWCGSLAERELWGVKRDQC